MCLACGFLLGLYVYRRLRRPPIVGRRFEFSIGIYVGDEPYRLGPTPAARNPVLTAADVTDVEALLVADPFLVRDENQWFMFFEVLNARTRRGEIGLAQSSDGLTWTYRQIVVREDFHLSYPYAFSWNGQFYLVAEGSAAFGIRLYQATSFPGSWRFVKDLLRGNYLDSSLVYHDNLWWMFTADGRELLRLYSADDLLGTWREHPASPILVGDRRSARPGGRVILHDGRLIRFAQDYSSDHRHKVRAFRIELLTPVEYREHELEASPVLEGSGAGWNSHGMHHVDPQQLETGQWIAAVDGVARHFIVRW